MNRILWEESEISPDGSVLLSDKRAAHILNVLHGTPGQTIQTGTVNGLAGHSTIVETTAQSARLLPCHDTRTAAPWLDLILACPRPKVLKRLWAQLATMGVRRIAVIHAGKVEKFYFSSQWLSPDAYRPLLFEGLQQAGTTDLPEVFVRPLFKPFFEDELDSLFPADTRLLAHPATTPSQAMELPSDSPVTLAIGPEGGWTDYELRLFQEKGFQFFSLGSRTLRTDTACIALISVLDWIRSRKKEDGQ